MTTNRTAIISKLYKVIKKHYKPITPPADRTALEHLLYGCLLENSRYEAADEAFAKLKELLRKAAERTREDLWDRIGELLREFSPEECSNYIRHAGYG